MTQTIQNTTNTTIDANVAVAHMLADGVAPLFAINDTPENVWWLWLDFLLEIQSKLMIASEAGNEDGFAFRCAENFEALRKMLAVFADNKVTLQQLQGLKNELQLLKKEPPAQNILAPANEPATKETPEPNNDPTE